MPCVNVVTLHHSGHFAQTKKTAFQESEDVKGHKRVLPRQNLHGGRQAYAVPDAPTPAQARAALQTLTALLSEFDFATPHDQAAALAGMLTASTFGSTPAMVRDAAAQPNPDMQDAMRDIADERGGINRRRLGKWIARQAGVIVGGLRFERASGHTAAERWLAMPVVAA
ncbi:MAG TPA: hypothetical protein DDW41_02655 [Candidatus Andersenbacteria bacterium]|nr:hypothetical protein [Candidatus Andersenbacteria bacterium]